MSFLVISKGKLAFDIECNIWITKYFQSTMFVSVYLFIVKKMTYAHGIKTTTKDKYLTLWSIFYCSH